MNVYMFLLMLILVGRFLLDLFVEVTNVRHISLKLPDEFKGVYEQHKYEKAQRYLKDKSYFGLVQEGVVTLVVIVFVSSNGVGVIDNLARNLCAGYLCSGFVFGAILFLATRLLSIPFEVYHTFVIEQKYGFNKTTPGTFISDFFKSLFLSLVILGIMLFILLWFFNRFGSFAWLYAWLTIIAFQTFLIYIAPSWILPLFNKFKPINEGEFVEELEKYARSQHYDFQGVYSMDASKRSTKGNAFFTGFGKNKKIAIFDTLLQNYTPRELVAVLAHEIGHFKLGHIKKLFLMFALNTGLFFAMLALFVSNKDLAGAFGVEIVSIHVSLLFVMLFFYPLGIVLSVLSNFLSRRYEFEADGFVLNTYPNAGELKDALKKLSVQNLSNLTPHPLKVFFDYSHPPILKRLERLSRGRV